MECRYEGASLSSAAHLIPRVSYPWIVFILCSEVLQSSSSLSGSISEKGLLQLLFDVRFLSDALAGGKPLNDTPAPSKTTR